jgi:hypothetical protein
MRERLLVIIKDKNMMINIDEWKKVRLSICYKWTNILFEKNDFSFNYVIKKIIMVDILKL